PQRERLAAPGRRTQIARSPKGPGAVAPDLASCQAWQQAESSPHLNDARGIRLRDSINTFETRPWLALLRNLILCSLPSSASSVRLSGPALLFSQHGRHNDHNDVWNKRSLKMPERNFYTGRRQRGSISSQSISGRSPTRFS